MNQAWQTLKPALEHTDLYLLDLMLKGRLDGAESIIDAGCGYGRNLPWFVLNGKKVCGCDRDATAVAGARHHLKRFDVAFPEENIVQCAVEEMEGRFPLADIVICSAVLHFAKDDAQWRAMVNAMWACLKPGGLLFARLMSTTGIKDRLVNVSGNIWQLPDGSARYMVNDTLLLRTTHGLGARFAEPLKTVVVENQRAMATWVISKP